MTRVEPPLPHWQALAFPFHQWTWLAIVLGFIASGPLLFLLAWCSDRCGGEIRSLQSLSYSWYYTFGMHLCEAHVSLPRNPSTQIFVLFLWLYTVILTIVYAANLKSFLLVKKQPTVMQTFQDVYESGIEVGGTSKIHTEEFASSINPYVKGLEKVFRYYDAVEKVIPQVLEGRSVYLTLFTSAYLNGKRFTKRGASRVRMMKANYKTYYVAMGLQRHSPLKRKLDQLIGWVQQSGLVSQFLQRSLRTDASLKKDDGGVDDSGNDQEDASADDVIPLSIDHMQGLFLITYLGWLCSLLFFILEKTICSYHS
ncbi:ionotropic receptor 21a-like [Panulirus ornatus]|uniref:ionotropic receptor 21a-like n=1 Tax=Panulirus ornatus TaxID=150431 RepID=UPI003A84AB2E